MFTSELPDGLFSDQKSQFGLILRALDWKMLVYFKAIWNILRTFGVFYDHLAHLMTIWYIFPVLVSQAKKNLATLVYFERSHGDSFLVYLHFKLHIS
jgi:hypothetical protein